MQLIFVICIQIVSGGGIMENEVSKEVIVTDIRMPVGAMMSFMLKLALASIPAVLVLVFVVYLVSLYVFSMFHG